MKCLFDNNLSSKLSRTLNYLEGDKGIIVEHIREKFSADTPDIDWIRQLEKEGDWFIITKDNQIRKKPHERKVWKESHIPIVFLQKTWMNHEFWEIAWRLIRYWPKLKQTITNNRKVESFELTVKGKITVIK